MQSLEDKKAYDNVVRKTCLTSNLIYLLTHIAYLIFFLVTKTYALVYVNIFSVLFYMGLFLLVRAKKYNLYAKLCGVEIFTYMTVATILTGLLPGFHLCIIGLCIIAFFTGYFSKKVHNLLVPLIWTIMSAIAYLILFFYCQYNEPCYYLEDWAAYTLLVVHSLVVFGFIAGYLYTFTRYALKLEDRIKKESRTDRLTLVPNRYALYNYLDSLEDKENYVLAMIDIDDFKKINDCYGHICGDYMLKEIALILSENDTHDFVSRYGGEEFIVISKIEIDLNKTLDKIDDIRKTVSNYKFIYEDNVIHSTITIGVSRFDDEISIDEWINKSDEKLYQGKRSGKNITIM